MCKNMYLSRISVVFFLIFSASCKSRENEVNRSHLESVTNLCPDRQVTREQVLRRLGEFSAKHNLTTTIAFNGCPQNPKITCGAVEDSDFLAIWHFVDQIDREFSVYPKGFFKTIHLEYLVFGNDLTAKFSDQGALGGYTYTYGANQSVVFISTKAIGTCYEYVNRRLIHHEIGHAIDYGYARASAGSWWRMMNPSGFTYGNIETNANDITNFSHPREGAISKYALYNVNEDYAEIYTALFFPEIGNDLKSWTSSDRYLRAKFKSVTGALNLKWSGIARNFPNAGSISN